MFSQPSSSSHFIFVEFVAHFTSLDRHVFCKKHALMHASGTFYYQERVLEGVSFISNFRLCIFVHASTVTTDHHCFCWLTNLKFPSSHLAWCALKLQEYNVTAAYTSGQKNLDADCHLHPVDDDDSQSVDANTIADI